MIFILWLICLKNCYVLSITGYPFPQGRHLHGIVLYDVVLQMVFLAVMVRLCQLQLRHLHVQLHLFPDMRVACRKCLYLGIGQCHIVDILAGAHRGLARHDLPDELLLVLDQLPVVRIEGILCHIPEDLYLFIHVALTDDTPFPLLKVGRPPWAVQMVQGYEPVLHVRSRSHLKGRTQQKTDLPASYLCKQLRLLPLRFGFMYVGYLILRDSLFNELLPYVIVDIEAPVPLRRGQV